MTTRLKALCLGLLSVLAVTAFGVMSAVAEDGGHFESEVAHTTIKGTETPATGVHTLHFRRQGTAEEIGCTEASYTGTTTNATETGITVTPSWSKCYTTPNGTEFEVHENGCHFIFTIGKSTKIDHTVHLKCPIGKKIEITHPNCNITVGEQTLGGEAGNGVVYKTVTEEGKHAITLEVTVKNIVSTYHEKICIFLGTNQISEMNGSVTVRGFDTDNKPVHITATN